MLPSAQLGRSSCSGDSVFAVHGGAIA